VQDFIGRNNLPVVGTFQSAGAVSAQLLKNFGGRVGQLANQPANRLLDAADLVITIGYDAIEYSPSLWNGGNSRKLIHVDVLPADLDNSYCPTVELQGNIAATLKLLTPQLKRAHRSALSEDILRRIKSYRDDLANRAAGLGGTPIHPMRLVHELQPFLGTDITLCLDMGSFHLWMARHLYSLKARQILITNGQQTLGVALPWAIAASIVRPAEKVLSISGDGGFLFSAAELETAVRLKQNHCPHGLDRRRVRHGTRTGGAEVRPAVGHRFWPGGCRQVRRGIRCQGNDDQIPRGNHGGPEASPGFPEWSSTYRRTRRL
jgi:acetolactate synthase-1/2/3 large subunit